MDKEKCDIYYYESETEEHLNGKRDLYEWIKDQDGVKNAILEGWIAETKQRPDIMFEFHNKKYVIEYQCTPIATEYYKRHDLYRASGINDIWICGVENYLDFYHDHTKHKRVNTLESNCGIYYDQNTKQIYYLPYTDEKEFKRLNKIYDIRMSLKYCSKYKQTQYLKRQDHIMLNPYDYVPGMNNYLYTKGNRNTADSYICIGHRYPSPTGRPSNKYPYPVAINKYDRNMSLARCYKLENLRWGVDSVSLLGGGVK